MTYDELVAISERITVRLASSIADMARIAELRYKGYGCFKTKAGSLDDLDFAPNCTLLVAEVQGRGIVGTLRLLEGSSKREPVAGCGEIEMQRFLNLSAIDALKERTFIEATRLVVARCPEILVVKTLLCKALWLKCLAHDRELLLVWAKDSVASFYKFLLMEDVGKTGIFLHPVLSNKEHRTYVLDSRSLWQRHDVEAHPYADFILRQKHNIFLDPGVIRSPQGLPHQVETPSTQM